MPLITIPNEVAEKTEIPPPSPIKQHRTFLQDFPDVKVWIEAFPIYLYTPNST